MKDSAWLIIYPSAYPASLFIVFSGLRGKINIFIFWFLPHNPTEAILVAIGSPVPSNSVEKKGKKQGKKGKRKHAGVIGKACGDRVLQPALACLEVFHAPVYF